MKYKTVGVVLGVLAIMVVGTAFAASNTSDIEVLNQELRNALREGNETYAAELMNRLRDLKGYTEEAIVSPEAPEGILERAPFMAPSEGMVASPLGYEYRPFDQDPAISFDHTCASTWLGPEGWCDTSETSWKAWFRYIMYDGETIEWVIDCPDAADYDIQIWEYLPCCQKGEPLAGAFSQFHPDTITYTDTEDGVQQWLWVEIHKYGTGSGCWTIRGVRHSKKYQPQYLTSYALNDWGYPTNGVVGTFAAHPKPDTHFYTWVVPSYFDTFHLQVSGVGACSICCPPVVIDKGIRVEIWNDCNTTLLDSIICDDTDYPDKSAGLQGWQDSVVMIKVIDTSTAHDYDVCYRLDFNYFFDKVPCICAKPEAYDIELDKGQCREYIFVIENCGNEPSLSLTYKLKETDPNAIMVLGHGAGGVCLAPGEVDTDTVVFCGPMPVDPTLGYDYYATIIVDVEATLYNDADYLDKEIPVHVYVPPEEEGKPNKVLLSADYFYEVLGLQDSAFADGAWLQYIEFQNTGTSKLHWYFKPDTAYDDVKGCNGEDIGDFTWLKLSQSSGALAPGATQKVYLYFRSGMMFPKNHKDSLYLFTDDPDDQEEKFVFELKVKAPNKILTPDPGGLISTDVLCCHTTEETITIGNDGNVNLVVDKIRWDPWVEWLSIPDAFKDGFIVEPGDEVDIPLTIDSHGASLVWCDTSYTTVLIEDNDPYCVDPETVYVKVKLVGPKIWIHPQMFHATLKAGPKQDGDDSKQKLQIINPGCDSVLRWSIAVKDESIWMKVIPSSGVIAPEPKTGKWDSVDIYFDTQTPCVPPGNFVDTLILTNNSCDDPEIKIPVILRAEGAWVSTVPEELEVTIPKCKTHKEILQICNIGADTCICGSGLKATATISLHIDSITVSGTWGDVGGPGVSISPAGEHYIEPQKCHDFEVTFDTHAAGVGEFTGIIRIWIHDGNANHQEPYFDVPVTFIVTGSGMTVTGGPIHDSLVVCNLLECENCPDISVAEHELIITNGGDEDLEWSLFELPFVSWMQCRPMGGVVAPLGAATVTVELNACQLEPCSTYVGYIVIIGNDQTNPADTVSVKLTVGEPDIYLSKTEIDFGPMQPCEDACENGSFVIQNDGPHIDLVWAITEDPDASWLSVTPMEGVLDQYDEQTISLKACADDLPADIYETDLVISSNDPDGDVSVHVTMTVHAAWVEVSPASFDIHVSYEKCKDTMLIITNTGNKPSDWHAQLDAPQDWFSFEPDSGTVDAAGPDGPGLDTIFMEFCHVEGMDPGDFAERTFVFDAVDDNCAPKDLIPVKITIDAPDIAVAPPCFYITLGLEESLDTTFTICNEGDAELNIHDISNVSCAFLTVNDTTPYAIDPGECVDVPIHFYTSISLECCTTYVDTIVITSNDPDENPTTICVALDIECPMIRVTETAIAETLAADEVACPASFYVVNDGCLDLEWLLTESPYVSWMSFDPVTGTTQPGDSTLVTVCFDGPELAATGEVDGTTDIVITSNDPKVPTKSISVSFHITSTKLAVNTGNIEIGVNVGDSMDKLFEITNTSNEIITWNLACRDNVDWLEYPKSGAVNPGETETIAVHFDATNLSNGTYSTALTLTSGGYSTDIPVKFIVSLKGVEERGLPEIGTCEAVYLSSNSPNPFASKTSFVYGVPSRTPVTMKVYDCTGKEVKALVDATVDAGYYKVSWDGTDSYGNKLVSGIYFYRITADGTSITKKLILLR